MSQHASPDGSSGPVPPAEAWPLPLPADQQVLLVGNREIRVKWSFLEQLVGLLQAVWDWVTGPGCQQEGMVPQGWFHPVSL